MIFKANPHSGKTILLVMLSLLAVIGWLIQPTGTLSAASPTATPTPQALSVTRSASAPNQTFSVFLPFTVKAAQPAPTLKKGGSLATGYTTDCASLALVGAYWEFDWTPSPPNCSGIDNVPMFWNGDNINGITLGGNSNWILGFNEPDSSSQANMTPQQAADVWRQIEQKYPNKKLAAPAPSGANPDWIVSFRTAYITTYGTAPRLDALTVHCYSWYANLNPTYGCIPHTLKFEAWATQWGVPEVWVTEFSFATTAPSSPSQSIAETTTFINWMQSQSQVKRYALFTTLARQSDPFVPGGFLTPLVDPNTKQLTSYGSMYVTYK
jgi:hypothetical protein